MKPLLYIAGAAGLALGAYKLISAFMAPAQQSLSPTIRLPAGFASLSVQDRARLAGF